MGMLAENALTARPDGQRSLPDAWRYRLTPLWFAALACVTGCGEWMSEGGAGALPSGPVGVTLPPSTLATTTSKPESTDRDSMTCGAPGIARTASAAPRAPEGEFSDTDSRALADFRSVLEAYGTWEDDEAVGTAWFPSPNAVGRQFTPYLSAGHWAFGEELIWISDYTWGWVPFHYGRWAFTGARGWAWIPGRRYGGAWVDWRVDPKGEAVGWAPMAPSWFWQDGSAYRVETPRSAAFVYVGTAHFFEPAPSGHVVGFPEVFAISARTRPYLGEPERSARDREQTHVEWPAKGGGPPSPSPPELGIRSTLVARPPTDDPSLQRAWLLARPSTAAVAGVRPALAQAHHLSTWVAGPIRYVYPSRQRSDAAN